jgi:hypothetical protein
MQAAAPQALVVLAELVAQAVPVVQAGFVRGAMEGFTAVAARLPLTAPLSFPSTAAILGARARRSERLAPRSSITPYFFFW